MAEYQDIDILGAAVVGELGQHLQDLAQEEAHQRGGHGHEHGVRVGLELAQNRTSDGRREYSSRTGLFTGVRGQQIAARCVTTRTGKFPYRDEWRSMVATISSLSHIIRAAAIYAIVEGSEQITRDLLDVIVVDHATESAAPKPPRPRESHA